MAIVLITRSRQVVATNIYRFCAMACILFYVSIVNLARDSSVPNAMGRTPITFPVYGKFELEQLQAEMMKGSVCADVQFGSRLNLKDIFKSEELAAAIAIRLAARSRDA